MRDATFYASSLLDLDKVAGAAERRASWRQSMAALATATAGDGPGPLEGLNPAALVAGARAALDAGLVDDLDWLAPAAAGTALFELASALPPGSEQRELGRRVLARTLAADAPTFTAIARRMAMASRKGLGSGVLRARLALVTELPLGLGVADGPLALVIAARRELARDWIGEGSTGSLPSRRLAARLLERAAREAARRAAYGDDHSLRVFRNDVVAPAWKRLLDDRESLVWRHVAVARGLLAPWDAALSAAIDDALLPSRSPTEWRRAAASVAAHVAVAPEAALTRARRALGGGLLKRDPGAAGAFLWGLPRAAEAEPAAALELFELVVEQSGVDVAEAVVELRAELGPSPLSERAATRALELSAGRKLPEGDEGAATLAHEVEGDLAPAREGEEPLRALIARALASFATGGAKEAHALARDALAAAQGALLALEGVTPALEASPGRDGVAARRRGLAVLRDLDLSLLERDVLVHLLALGGGDAAAVAEGALDPLRDRMAEWILARDAAPGADAPPAAFPTAALRRLRALVHLVDSDIGAEETDAARAGRLRQRWLRIARALLGRLERGLPSALRRTLVAALGRALDALVRTGACDEVDVLLVAATAAEPGDLATLAEASMAPDLVHVLASYARFAAAMGRDGSPAEPLDALGVFEELTREIAPEASGRIEALRTVLVRVASALRVVASAKALADLGAPGAGEIEPIAALEGALASLRQLAAAARGRFEPAGEPGVSAAPPATEPLARALSQVLSGAAPPLEGGPLAERVGTLVAGSPRALAALVSAILARLAHLPIEGPLAGPSSLRVPEALPSWLPPARTLGGFYVLRSLGAGAGGSVFVATRADERSEPSAERLALKVPEYSATAARSLSEGQFLEMFRAEAGALLALPRHPNLARFVTFDAGSKPKPILVMELVEGPTLERVVQARQLDVPRALQVLDDLLAGLEAMHAAGVGHLDVKPSNVVLRGGRAGVLVDFGLAGRHLRPGCATGPYGAPEVWGALDGVPAGTPANADLYAFGCVAFEALTGQILFDADSELMQVAMHVSHDGLPRGVQRLAKDRRLAPLVELLFATLRRNPTERIPATEARRELRSLLPVLGPLSWPLGAGA